VHTCFGQQLQAAWSFCEQECIPTSLLKMNADSQARAIRMFAGVQKYMGEGEETITDATRMDIAQKLLHQAIKRPELKDELYMQLVKQVTRDASLSSGTAVAGCSCIERLRLGG
jgi:MyTH4 domain